MYDELVKSLRVCGRMTSIDDNCISYVNGCCEAFPDCAYALMDQAADAIEELSRQRNRAYARLCEWCGVCPEGKRNAEDCEIAALNSEPPKEE